MNVKLYKISLADGSTPGSVSVDGENIKPSKQGLFELTEKAAAALSDTMKVEDVSAGQDPHRGDGPFTAEELQAMKGPELNKICKDLGLQLAGNASKAAMIEAIIKHQEEAG